MKRNPKSQEPTPRVPLNVRVEHDLMRELRLLCAARRADGVAPWQIQDVVTEALRAWMKKNTS